MKAAGKMMTKKQLEKRITEDREALSVIEERIAGEQSAKLYRKCFKYRNCYSCPKRPEDYFWLYARVVVVEGSTITTKGFQDDGSGRLEFITESRNFHLTGWLEITETEFIRAFNVFANKIICP